jgi:hypothetical protein
MVGHGYQTDWAITTVNPQPYFDCLAATVEQLGATRSVLRQVIMLADDAASHREKIRTVGTLLCTSFTSGVPLPLVSKTLRHAHGDHRGSLRAPDERGSAGRRRLARGRPGRRCGRAGECTSGTVRRGFPPRVIPRSASARAQAILVDEEGRAFPTWTPSSVAGWNPVVWCPRVGVPTRAFPPRPRSAGREPEWASVTWGQTVVFDWRAAQRDAAVDSYTN